jgi:hypothetical protein
LELLKNWASKRAVVSVNFEDNTYLRLALSVTARIDDRGPEFLRLDLRPENWGSPAASYLIFRFDGSEDWEEVRDDPLGGIRCLFKRPGGGEAILSLLLVPEGLADSDPELVPGEQ